MSEDKRINLVIRAMRLQGYNMSMEATFAMIKTLERVSEVGEDFSIKDAVEIEVAIESKYPKYQEED